MGKIFKTESNFGGALQSKALVMLCLAVSLFSGCSNSEDRARAQGDIQVSNVVNEIMNRFNACDKKDLEKQIDESQFQKVWQLEDQVEVADIQFLRCDGSVAKEDHGPVRRVEFLVPYAAAKNIDSEVHFVVFENERTCSRQVVALSKKVKIVTDPAKIQDLKELDIKDRPPFESILQAGGVGQIRISDSPLKLKEVLNVKPGLNPIRVQYFGKCLEFKATASAGNSAAYDFDQCVRAAKLSETSLLIRLSVSPLEVSGTYTFDICENK